jgi:hypothetical protein
MVWILIFRSRTLLHESLKILGASISHWPLKTFSADFLDLAVDYITRPIDVGLSELVGHI